MTNNSFQSKWKEYYEDDYSDDDDNELLKTIRVPKNLMYLSNRLPNSNYEKIAKTNFTKSYQKKLTQGRNHQSNSNPSGTNNVKH